MFDVLEEIVAHKRTEVARARRERPMERLQALAAEAPPVRGFAEALRSGSGMRIIAEVKRASPSAGLIRPDFDPVAIARIYAANGAACISVLTDEKFFQGRLEYLTAIRAAVPVPVLRKDFILDRYQVLEARAAGADCILLIAECLTDCELRDLYFYASELGLESLIEIHDPENLERVLKLEPEILGVNNRNLKTFVTDLDHTLRLRPRVPDSTVLVSESGIHTREHILRLEHAGVRAALIGETLMRAPDIGATLRELLVGRPL